jgi:hypothetical protein
LYKGEFEGTVNDVMDERIVTSIRRKSPRKRARDDRNVTVLASAARRAGNLPSSFHSTKSAAIFQGVFCSISADLHFHSGYGSK